MGLFEKKSTISRRALKRRLGEAKGERRLNRRQREGLVRQVFTRKPRALIFKEDYKIALRNLKDKRHKTKNYREKLDLTRKIKFLEEFEKT